MNTDKTSLENEIQPSCLGAVKYYSRENKKPRARNQKMPRRN